MPSLGRPALVASASGAAARATRLDQARAYRSPITFVRQAPGKKAMTAHTE
jgi:hypothetical protein